MSDLTDYCQELLREGERESTGRFTVDYARARASLSQNLFADPSNYLLKFIQYAVAQKAAPIMVQTRRQDLQISFQGRQLQSEDMVTLKDLLGTPQEAATSPWRDLILSLYAAQALNPDFLLFASRDEAGGQGLMLHHDRADVVQLPAGAPAQILLLRRSSRESLWRRLFCSPRHISQDCHTLVSRCRHSWSPIMLDNRALPPDSVQFKRGNPAHLVERIYLSRSQPDQLLALPPFSERPALIYDLNGRSLNLDTPGRTLLHQWRSYSSQAASKPLFEVTRHPTLAPETGQSSLTDPFSASSGKILLYQGPYRSFSAVRDKTSLLVSIPSEGFTQAIYSHKSWFSAATPYPAAQLYIVCPTQPTREESLVFVCHYGVLLEPVTVSLPLKDVRVVVADHQAQTDLTGLQLVRDERFQEFVEWLAKEVSKMRDESRRVLRFHDGVGLSESHAHQLNQLQALGL